MTYKKKPKTKRGVATEVKEEIYLFKGSPGNYGKGKKQSKPEDFIKILNKDLIPKIPLATSSKIYTRNQRTSIDYKHILGGAFIICIFIVISLVFILNEYIVNNRLENARILIVNLCFAFITSYIFYLVVIVRNEELKKREAYAIVCGVLDSLLENSKNVKKWLMKSAGEEITLSKFESNDIGYIKKLCDSANVFEPLDENGNSAAILLNRDGVKMTNYFIEKIFIYMPFIDGELIYLLNKLQNCNFSKYVRVLPFKADKNLSEFHLDIKEYLDILFEIEGHNNKLKLNYLKNYTVK